MKTLILIAILAATVGNAWAQYGFGPYDDSQRNRDAYRQQQEIENLERRQRELENRQRELERQRFEARQWRNDPLRSPIERSKCRPGQTLC